MPSFKTHFPNVPLSIQDVIANDLLNQRPSRQPDHAGQVVATTSIIKALTETPDSVLDKLSRAIQLLTGADSAGVSLSGREAGNRVFLWQAAVGLFEKYLGSVVPYDESPCGSVITTEETMLMVEPGQAYKTAAQVSPPFKRCCWCPSIFTVGRWARSGRFLKARKSSMQKTQG